jgi:hypothetical protein
MVHTHFHLHLQQLQYNLAKGRETTDRVLNDHIKQFTVLICTTRTVLVRFLRLIAPTPVMHTPRTHPQNRSDP